MNLRDGKFETKIGGVEQTAGTPMKKPPSIDPRSFLEAVRAEQAAADERSTSARTERNLADLERQRRFERLAAQVIEDEHLLHTVGWEFWKRDFDENVEIISTGPAKHEEALIKLLAIKDDVHTEVFLDRGIKVAHWYNERKCVFIVAKTTANLVAFLTSRKLPVALGKIEAARRKHEEALHDLRSIEEAFAEIKCG